MKLRQANKILQVCRDNFGDITATVDDIKYRPGTISKALNKSFKETNRSMRMATKDWVVFAMPFGGIDTVVIDKWCKVCSPMRNCDCGVES